MENIMIYKMVGGKIHITSKPWETYHKLNGDEIILYIKYKNKKELAELNFAENEIIFDDD